MPREAFQTRLCALDLLDHLLLSFFSNFTTGKSTLKQAVVYSILALVTSSTTILSFESPVKMAPRSSKPIPTPAFTWTGEYQMPDWILLTKKTDSKMKRWSKVSEIEALGFDVATPCTRCLVKGYDCKVKLPQDTIACSRCVQAGKPCSLVST